MSQDNKKKVVLQDVYDLTLQALEVHSENSELNPDFTLADLSKNPLENNISKFVIEQLKLIRNMEDFLLVEDEPVYSEEGIITEWKNSDKLTKIVSRVKKLLLSEVESMLTLTRSVDGQVLKAVLEFAKSQNQIDSEEEQRMESNKHPLNQQVKA